MAKISEILGTDDNWQSTEYRAERLKRGEWNCRQTDERYQPLRSQTVDTKRDARRLLHEWGATRLIECPTL